jgi:diguanylate cyclase
VFAERLRIAVETTEFPIGGRNVTVTISLGVAGLPQVDATEPMAVVAAADVALYQAKRAGRNRVVSAPNGPVTTAVASAITQTRT